MTITVRTVSSADRGEWDRLYAGYAEFYEVDQSDAMRNWVWKWLMDDAHSVEGLVADAGGGSLAGLAHFRLFARPLTAATGGFLDDLFVDPAFRGQDIGARLIGALGDIGRERGWGVIRWITASDNERARRVYDKVAAKTEWLTYDLDLG